MLGFEAFVWNRFVCRMGFAVALCLLPAAARGQSIKLAEPYTDTRTFQVGVEVKTDGEVLTAGIKGVDKLPLSALAQFQLRERRLPPAGRDAQALRAAREYEIARLSTEVSGEKSSLELPSTMRVVVAEGRQEGVSNFSPVTMMTRDAVDLLELPGDTLCLLAMLPLSEVTIGETWTPPDWAAQMLAGIEAVESTALTCKLDAVEENKATITFEGNVKGQRLGANTHCEVRGRMVFDVDAAHIREASMAFTIKAGVGTVVPGLDVKVSVRMARRVAKDSGALTDDFLRTIPLEAAQENKLLAFDAPPWGTRLRHGRDWHIFKTIFDGQQPMAILRLMERGSLICQCNMSPVPSAAAGDHTPVGQFESDIQKSLGKKFRRFVSQEQLPSTEGRFVYRVAVEGEVELATSKKSEDGKSSTTSMIQVPMNWVYYLCADRSGRQMSFVFSVEPPLMEQLGGRDRQMVETLEFYRPVTAASPTPAGQ